MWKGFVQYGDLSLDSNKNMFHCVHFHVCETQRTRVHVTDTTATHNGHQMAVVTWDRFFTEFEMIDTKNSSSAYMVMYQFIS